MKTEAELNQVLSNAKALVDVGATYRHFKGSEYVVKGVALEESSMEPVVIYESTSGITFTRPLVEFVGIADNGDKRFMKV
jgi:hypothetical protein